MSDLYDFLDRFYNCYTILPLSKFVTIEPLTQYKTYML